MDRLLTAVLGAATVAGATPAVWGQDTAHYEVRLEVSPAGGTIEADVEITLPAEEGTSAEFFLGERFDLHALLASGGGRVEVVPDGHELPNTRLIRVEFPGERDGPETLSIAYSGPLNVPEGDYTIAALDEEMLELRLDFMWLPTAAGINLLYTLDAEIEGIPEDFVLVSQGEVSREDGLVRIEREMPDFDFVLVAAPGLQSRNAPGVEVFAQDFDYVLTDIVRRHAASSVAWMQDWMGPLPHGDVRLAVLPRSSGAYARRGYVVMAEAREAVEALEEELPEWGPARLVAHEFAHAWWSPADPLTEHYWLSESVAEYVALRYLEAEFGLETAETYWASKLERAVGATPLLGEGRPSGNALYQRGPMLLRELEQRVGRDTFDRVIARLAGAAPRETAQFMSVLAEEAGPEHADWFDALMRTGPGPWRDDLVVPEAEAEAAQ